MNLPDETNSSSIIKYTTGELIDIQIALNQRVFAENDPLTHYKNAVKEKAHTYIRKHTQPPTTSSSSSSSASSRPQRPGKETRSTKNFDFEAFKRQEDQKHTGERFSSPTKDSKAAAFSINTTLDFFGLDKVSDDKFISLDDIDDFSKLKMADTDDVLSFNNLTPENDNVPQQLPPPPPSSSNDVDDGFDDDFGPNVDIDSAFADKPETEGNDAIQRMLFQSGDFGIGGGGVDGHPIPPPMPVSSITDYNNPTNDVTPNQSDVVNNTAFSNDLFSKIQMASIEQQHLNNEKVNHQQQQNNFNNIFAQNNNVPFVQNNNNNFVQNAVTANDSFVQNNQYGSIPIQNIFGNNNQINVQPTMVQMQPFGSFTQVYPGMINQVKAQPSQPFNLLAPQPQYISPSKQQSLMLMQKQQMLALQQRKMQLKNHQKQHQQQHAGLSTDEGSRTLRKLYGLEDGDTAANNAHHKGNSGGYNQQMTLKQQQQQHQFQLQKQQQQLSMMQKQQQQHQLSMMQKQQLQNLQKQQQQLLMLQKQQHQQIKIERVAGIRQNGMNAAQKTPQKQTSYHSSEQFPPLK